MSFLPWEANVGEVNFIVFYSDPIWIYKMKCYQVAAVQLRVWRPGSVSDAGHWDVVFALNVTDSCAVTTLENWLAKLDPLSAWAATLHNHDCLLLEGVLTENKTRLVNTRFKDCTRWFSFGGSANQIVIHSGDLNTKLVHYLNGQKMSDHQMFQYLNAIWIPDK